MKILRKLSGIIISLIFLLIVWIVNVFVSINIMLSENITSILESTITFTSIVLGLSSALLGCVISAKNEKNRFITWYFKKVDKSTFIFIVMASTISALVLIALSILLLSYDILSDTLRFLATCGWTVSLVSFIVYQAYEYKLFLNILFFDDGDGSIDHITKPQNLTDSKKKQLFEEIKASQDKTNSCEISVDTLINH